MLRKHLRYKLALCLISLCFTQLSLADEWVYTVVDGDNLWNFSKKHLDKVTRFEQLRKINNISDPTRMKPGSVVRVPMAWIKSNLVPARIHSITGQAEIERAQGKERLNASKAMEIYLGDVIRTGENSGVAIRFADNSIVSIFDQSIVRFDHLSAHGSTGMVDSRIKLLQGRLSSKVTTAVGPGSRFEIHTPSAISAVRGTAYRAVANDNGETSNIEVVEGKVAVAGGKSQTLVPAGFGTQVKAGEAPSKPKELLPAPQFKAIPNAIRQLNWRLEWHALDGAKAYRTEVSANAAFETLLWQGVSEYSKAALPDLPDGEYFVRVRGIDELGLEGLEKMTQFVLDARPQPPLPLKPHNKQSYRAEWPTLQWTESSDAERYLLELASDPEFNNLLLKEETQARQFNSNAVAELGDFYWRLTSIASDGEYGPVGVTRHYNVKPIPKEPQTAVASGDDGKLLASWEKTGEGQRYKVQIAKDKNFKRIIVDETTDVPQFAFAPHTGNQRYMRVKTIEADGYESPWGSTQVIEGLPDNSHWALILGIIAILII
ncbi:FecR domain-containing protein [uncultured Pseudoteredinibacter sp.]|uniref:FecR domain-containing protein n=1 Tax=uncultured Pseudoteredinibacter sp. TaxID=1641701 RepID=UPI00261C7D3E|nr:FecR domain-containing protein [uncultured Pseudoteredinibacter sp.]